MTSTSEATLEVLLDFVKRSRGFDFTGYKRSSLERRIRKRMDELGVTTYGDYLDRLEVDPDEFAVLFNTILINVTAFFRDAKTWEFLREQVLPDLLASRPDGPIRVWCAGCASGEEAYTTAMLLADALGETAYRQRVKIYATDVDEEALAAARTASYSAKQVEPVPREDLDRYFERADTRYTFRPDLRRTVIFGRNDVVQDAPISRIDLLLCRNTLMYFNAETQAQIVRRLHFALDRGGVLMLGKSEMLVTHSSLFQPIDLKRRIFRKVVNGPVRDRLHFAPNPGDEPGDGNSVPSLRDAAFDASPVAQLVTDGERRLVSANQSARQLFSLTTTDLGRPLQDLEVSYRPIELRSHLDEVRTERRPRTIQSVPFRVNDSSQRILDVQITPLVNSSGSDGACIAFVDVTGFRSLQDDLERSKHELEQAYEELQSTVEELETTNEELQSTNEELETTNEELQSTNEELETMNEELQSSNEELETINDELRTRTLELNEVNAFLETILTSMSMAVAVLDATQAVRVWNTHAEELWGLRADEVQGQRFSSLDIGLPVGELRQAIRTALVAEEPAEVTVQARNRRGRPITCRVSCLPLRVGHGGQVSGVILLMDATPADG
jgi:two-component system, chemotaxis family, CheB/CheR fusion protein